MKQLIAWQLVSTGVILAMFFFSLWAKGDIVFVIPFLAPLPIIYVVVTNYFREAAAVVSATIAVSASICAIALTLAVIADDFSFVVGDAIATATILLAIYTVNITRKYINHGISSRSLYSFCTMQFVLTLVPILIAMSQIQIKQ